MTNSINATPRTRSATIPATAITVNATVCSATALANALHSEFPMLAGRTNSRVTCVGGKVSVVVADALDVDHDAIRAFVADYAVQSQRAMAPMIVPVDQVQRYQRNFSRGAERLRFGRR